jgi:mutator protein MutT
MPLKLVVAALLWNDEKKILLARRPPTAKIAPNKYHLPGGHVEDNETPEEALTRELQEELNAKIQVGRPYFTATYDTPTGKSIVIFYQAKLLGISSKISPSNHELESCIWIEPKKAGDYLHADDYNLNAVFIGSA